MILLKEHRTPFPTKRDAFKWLKANKEAIIAHKKAQVFKSADKGQVKTMPFLRSSTGVDKLPMLKQDYFYPVINTIGYMDSHLDVHIKGIWNRSVKHNEGKLHYVDSHSMKLSDIIAWPENVTAMVTDVPWSAVGKNYEGMTEALVFEIPKSGIVHAQARGVIEEKRDIQNSVSMQYKDIKMAINDDDPDFADEKKVWDQYIDTIVNKEVAEEYGYFWAVKEAAIIGEGSMVIRGSNDATRNLYGSAESTPSQGSEKSTPDFDVSRAIQELKFNL